MKTIILVLSSILALMIVLVGCEKCINTEYENVVVNIIDEHYEPEWFQPVFTGKTMALIPHPAQYHITIEYNGIECTIDDRDTYDRYKDKVGQTTIGTLEIRTYDDGTVKYDIISLWLE